MNRGRDFGVRIGLENDCRHWLWSPADCLSDEGGERADARVVGVLGMSRAMQD